MDIESIDVFLFQLKGMSQIRIHRLGPLRGNAVYAQVSNARVRKRQDVFRNNMEGNVRSITKV